MRRPLVLSWLVCCVVIGLSGASHVSGQTPRHRLYKSLDPPGLIATRQHMARPALWHHVQPVELRVPEGSWVSIAVDGGFAQPTADRLTVGIQSGSPYRIEVTWVRPDGEFRVYPTIELLDRVYASPEQLARFPIPIEITVDDLRQALSGHLVTKVIYVEDPDLPVAAGGNSSVQPWFDVLPDEDPLDVADQMGRPVALVRLGSRVPDPAGPDEQFLMGCPPVHMYEPGMSAEPMVGADAVISAGPTMSADQPVYLQLDDQGTSP